jgi:hypothetical protein
MRGLSEKEMTYFTYVANNYIKLKDLHIAELEADQAASSAPLS